MRWARFWHVSLQVRPYGSGFLIFAITRPAIRLAALMKSGDLEHTTRSGSANGQTSACGTCGFVTRAIPGLIRLRPADASNGGSLAGNYATTAKPAVLSSSRGRRCPLRSQYAPASGVQQEPMLLVDAPDGKADNALHGHRRQSLCASNAYEQLKTEHQGRYW